MNSLKTDSYIVMSRSYHNEDLSHNSELSTECKILFFLIKQQLKKILRKFILHIVTALIYTLMKKIRPDFTKKLCWKSSLKCLQLCYEVQIQLSLKINLKFRMLYIVLLWWNNLTIYINDNADEAVHRYDINKLCQNWEVLNIYIDSSDIKNQIDMTAVTLKRDLRYMMYINIDKIFTVYIMKLQSLIMIMSIVSTMKMIKLKL